MTLLCGSFGYRGHSPNCSDFHPGPWSGLLINYKLRGLVPVAFDSLLGIYRFNIPFHDATVCAHQGSQISLINHQQIRLTAIFKLKREYIPQSANVVIYM